MVEVEVFEFKSNLEFEMVVERVNFTPFMVYPKRPSLIQRLVNFFSQGKEDE